MNAHEYVYTVASTHLSWIAGYGLITAAATVVALLITRRSQAGARSVPFALATGILWPVLAVALAQLGTLAVARFLAVRTTPPAY